jgi:tRNA nucleotidyltransferase (CCA-adding enzyme)
LIVWLSKSVGAAAAELNMVAYAVGGFVRDLNLGIPNFDLDYVIEGDAIELAESMQEKFPDKLKVIRKHERFHTATLEYVNDGERSVDFSTARTEFYEYPAALPTVERSQLDQDLMRRDFTINAMAICLNPSRYGELIDEFGGLDDLKHKVIRVLHPFSFIEDPTRIIRAVRFAARLGFRLNSDTAEQAKHAISIGIFDNLGGTRMRDELRSILESPQRLRGLELLSGLGAKLRYLDSDLEYTPEAAKAIRRAERLLSRYPLKDAWTVYLGLLLSPLAQDIVRTVLDRLHVTNDQKEIVAEGLSVRNDLPQMFEDLNRNGHGLKNSEIYHLLHGKPDESLAIVACLANPGSPVRRMIKLYLDKLEKTKTELTGNDLISLGFKEGPQLGVALTSVLDARLDGSVKTRNDEVRFIKQTFSHIVQPN